MNTAGLDAEYWYRNIRQTVQFDQAVRGACELGYRTFIESSPHPALIAGIENTFNDCVAGSNTEPIVVPTLGRDDGGLQRFLTSVATAFVAGVSVDWRGVLDGAAFVELPTYAFDRHHFWLTGINLGVDASGLGQGASGHALLGAVVDLPASGGVLLTGRLSTSAQPWLADHAVSGSAVFPGRASWSWRFAPATRSAAPVVEELTLQTPLLLPDGDSVALQVVVGPELDENPAAAASRSTPAPTWRRLGTPRRGRVGTGIGGTRAGHVGVATGGAAAIEVADGYERLAAHGYGYGPAFRGLTAVWARGDELFAEVQLPEQAGGVAGFGVHPALLDAALHAAVVAERDAELVLPFSWQGVSLHAAGASAVRARIAPARSLNAISIELADGLGLPVLSVRAMVARPVNAQQLRAALPRSGPDRLFEVIWSPAAGHSASADEGARTRYLNPLRPRVIRWRTATGAPRGYWPPSSRG